jgi:hypothetical protein
LKDLAQADPATFQFLVVKFCEETRGFTLQEGAFGPPPPSANGAFGAFMTYPNPHVQIIEVMHFGVKWDLIVPQKGKETDFGYRDLF